MQRLYPHVEQITGAALRPDVLRLARIGLDLAPQPEDLDIDGAVVHLGAMEPREVEQLLAREHPARRGAERLQQTEFMR